MSGSMSSSPTSSTIVMSPDVWPSCKIYRIICLTCNNKIKKKDMFVKHEFPLWQAICNLNLVTGIKIKITGSQNKVSTKELRIK